MREPGYLAHYVSQDGERYTLISQTRHSGIPSRCGIGWYCYGDQEFFTASVEGQPLPAAPASYAFSTYTQALAAIMHAISARTDPAWW
jgi:hypothetical protein